MPAADRLPPSLLRLADERFSIVARRELFDAGLTERQVRTIVGRSAVVLPGVYDIDASSSAWAERALRQRCWCAVLHCGGGALVDGVAALVLQGLDVTPPHRIEMSAPATTKVQSTAEVAVVRRRAMPRAVVRAGLPVAAVTDATLHLALNSRAAVHWVTLVCQQRLTTAQRLRDTLRLVRRHPTREVLDALLDDIESGSTSALELAFDRDVVRAHGLPRGQGQFRVPGGCRLADRAYERERLLVELDSIAFHSGPDRFGDLTRDIEHLVDGWTTVRLGWQQVAVHPCETAAQLHRLLVARGATPAFTACPRCVNVPVR